MCLDTLASPPRPFLGVSLRHSSSLPCSPPNFVLLAVLRLSSIHFIITPVSCVSSTLPGVHARYHRPRLATRSIASVPDHDCRLLLIASNAAMSVSDVSSQALVVAPPSSSSPSPRESSFRTDQPAQTPTRQPAATGTETPDFAPSSSVKTEVSNPDSERHPKGKRKRTAYVVAFGPNCYAFLCCSH